MRSNRPFARPARRVLAVLGLAGLLSLAGAGAAAPGAAASVRAATVSGATALGVATSASVAAQTAHKPVPAPPPGVPTRVDVPKPRRAASSAAVILWGSVGSISFAPSATTRPLGASVTLSGSTDTDLGPTPFYFQIWDLTSKTEVAYCGSGKTCTTTVTQAAATTHAYQATIAPWSTTYPPPNIQMMSEAQWVTWSATAGTLAGWNIVLSAPNLAYGSFTVTATANADVGPTPYDIVIYEEPGLGDGTGTLIRACGVGATCSVTIDPPTGMYSFVAFVGSYAVTLPPVNAQAASSPLPTYQH
jgi:hypothetical protein